MSRIKLNYTYRDEIFDACMTDTLRKEDATLREQGDALWWQVLNEAYGTEIAGMLRTLFDADIGKRHLELRNWANVSLPDGTSRQIVFATWLPVSGLRVSIKDPKLVGIVRKLADAHEDIIARRSRAETELRGFLKEAKTFEELLQVWPEGKAYIEPVYEHAKGLVKASSALMVVDGINKNLGLPKDDAATTAA